MSAASPAIIIDPMTELAVERGRCMCQELRDRVMEFKARGKPPAAVWVNADTAMWMRAFFAARCDSFDGVLPANILGVPLFEGSTGGDDVSFQFGD